MIIFMETNRNFEIKKNQRKPCIYILSLGGTISSKAKKPTDEYYSHPISDINELLFSLPIDNKKMTLVSEQLLQQISHEMTHDDLLLVAKRINELVKNEGVDGIVVTQGTNCIEETAYFISLVINTKKNIVFTGSHRPANALGFDGARNLYNAILLASNHQTSGMGVLLTFNDGIVSARDASKFNPSLLGDFSLNGLASIGFIQGNKIQIQKKPHFKHTYLSDFNINDINKEMKVYVIYGHLCADSIFVEAAIARNAIGIISAGLGKGYQPKAVTESLIQASKQGIFVVRCSRHGQGLVNKEPNFDDIHGFIAGGSLSPQKARILLSVAVSKTKDRMKIQQIFDEY